MIYYIEKLKVVDGKEWRDPNVNTFSWVRASELIFDSITAAQEFIDSSCDTHLNYRITNGEQIWKA